MTTCAECLASLATMRLADITPDSAVATHCATCSDCAAVFQEAAYAEKRLSNSLADLRPGMTPETIYSGALEAEERIRRQEIGRWVRWFLGAAAAATLLLFTRGVIVPRLHQENDFRTETISLHCLTPEQAMEIATPYLRSSGSISTPKGMRIVTIGGKHDEFEAAVSRVNTLDAECQLPDPAVAGPAATTPEGAPTSTDIPKKD